MDVLNQPPVNSGIRSPVVYAIPPPNNRNFGSNWGGGVVNNAYYPAFGQPTPVQWLVRCPIAMLTCVVNHVINVVEAFHDSGAL